MKTIKPVPDFADYDRSDKIDNPSVKKAFDEAVIKFRPRIDAYLKANGKDAPLPLTWHNGQWIWVSRANRRQKK
jgi:hypothetical protein